MNTIRSRVAKTLVWIGLVAPFINVGVAQETLIDTEDDIWFISDGSYRDGIGTSATVFGFNDHTVGYCVSITPGEKTKQSPFRSELAGMAAGIAIATVLFQHTQREKEILFGLDGLQAMRSVSRETSDIDQSDYDMIRFIRHHNNLLTTPIQWKWIKGHQDSLMSYYELDWEARVNIAADKLANHKSKQLSLTNYTPQIIDFSTDQIILKWKNFKVSKLRMNFLYDTITAEPTVEYWRNIRGWSEHISSDIDWHAFGDAFTAANHNIKRRVIRLASNHAPTGDNMVKWRKRDFSNCPACDITDEDMDHVLKCPKTKTKRESLIEEYVTQLDDIFDTATISVINQSLKRMSANKPQPRRHMIRKRLQEALLEQDALGWDNWLFGWISTKWRKLIVKQPHLPYPISKISRMKKIITFNWNLLGTIWDL